MSAIAMITGASGGVGQAAAQELHDSHNLALVGRDVDKLRNIYGDQHALIEADVSTVEGAEQAVKSCQEQLGLPNALINCAGNVLIKSLHHTTAEDYRECMAANMDSAFNTLRAFVANLQEHKQPGAAVLISSVAAQYGVSNHETVAAAKGGVEALVRAAAASYAPANIRVNGVAGGLMETPATETILENDLSREGAERQYPIHGVGQPDELAGVIAYLLSERAHWITGQIWNFDGGFSAVRPLVK